MPSRLDITDKERYEKMLKNSREWKAKKRANDPEWVEKTRKYNREYFQKVKEGYKKESVESEK
jgi:hypothetical protein